MMKKEIMLILIISIFAVLITGCQNTLTETKTTDNQIAKNSGNTPEKKQEAEKMNTIVTIETNKGIFKAELYDEKTPVTTKNFIELVKEDFYNNLTWHRYVKNFVIQGGDPKGDGTGGSGKNIPLEVDKELKHIKGALGMARSQDPNSASSQFYVTLAEPPNLDGGYAVFGHVIEGMDIVMQLREKDLINKITIDE